MPEAVLNAERHYQAQHATPREGDALPKDSLSYDSHRHL